MENRITQYIERLQNLHLIAEPVYDDGPYMSVQVNNATNEIFIFSWAGVNDENTAHKWVIYSVSKENLRKYAQREISEFALMCTASPNYIFNQKYMVADIFDDLAYSNICFFDKFSELPEEYLPSDKVLYEKKYSRGDKELFEFLQNNIDAKKNQVWDTSASTSSLAFFDVVKTSPFFDANEIQLTDYPTAA